MKYFRSFVAILTHPFPIPLFDCFLSMKPFTNVCNIHSFGYLVAICNQVSFAHFLPQALTWQASSGVAVNILTAISLSKSPQLLELV